MNEVERVTRYIRSCRDAKIDATITIDKNRIDLVLNALEKSIPKHPKNIHWTKFAGAMRVDFKSGKCPSCKEYVDTDDDYKFCSECGQRLDW